MKKILLLTLIIGMVTSGAEAEKRKHKPRNKHVERVQRKNRPGCFRSWIEWPGVGGDGFLHR